MFRRETEQAYLSVLSHPDLERLFALILCKRSLMSDKGFLFISGKFNYSDQTNAREPEGPLEVEMDGNKTIIHTFGTFKNTGALMSGVWCISNFSFWLKKPFFSCISLLLNVDFNVFSRDAAEFSAPAVGGASLRL